MLKAIQNCLDVYTQKFLIDIYIYKIHICHEATDEFYTHTETYTMELWLMFWSSSQGINGLVGLWMFLPMSIK